MKSAMMVLMMLSAIHCGVATAGSAVTDGMALGDFWDASAAEYQASAEVLLESIGGRIIREPDLLAEAMAGFLLIFSGGGGAPIDIVQPRAGAFEVTD